MEDAEQEEIFLVKWFFKIKKAFFLLSFLKVVASQLHTPCFLLVVEGVTKFLLKI